MSTRMYVCESAEHPVTLLSSLNEQRLKVLIFIVFFLAH